VPHDWPARGAVEFRDVHLRYDKDEPTILQGVSFAVQAGQRVGIVGRTGAGKSSLVAALFRLTAIEGEVRIDGVATCAVSLERLRQSLSVIPQDPMLFSASIRSNLDPLGEHGDNRLWDALEAVQLGETVKAMSQGLETPLTEGGSNLSVGQRQLVCLARAILRQSRILVLDEATASIDSATDGIIQHAIRTRFRGCTVLTIAHRINTIIDSDMVLVLESGRVVEYDTPARLLEKADGGVFRGMVQVSTGCLPEHTEGGGDVEFVTSIV
jgi:ATP-binding cassette, subfamily C (CFTR/MRP), member 4